MGKRKGTAILAALFLIAGLSAVGTATASATTPTTPTSPAVGTRHGLPAVGRIDGHVVRGLPPYSKAGVEPCSDNCGGYEYSSSFVPIGDLTDVTSGSVDMTDNGDEGNLENNDAWTGDHSLGDFVIMCVNNLGNSTTNETPLYVYACTGTEPQQSDLPADS